MPTLNDLNLLAKHGPIIFGRALSFEEAIRTAPLGGRPDAVDSKSREIQKALWALSCLYKLDREQPQVAKILYYTHVTCGEEMRSCKQTWIDLGLAIRVKKPKKMTAKMKETLADEALAAYAFARHQWKALDEKGTTH